MFQPDFATLVAIQRKLKTLSTKTDLTNSDPLTSDVTFFDLGVDKAIVDSLEAEGIVKAFPIQEYALPLALDGVDVIGQARTGTGKTLAFGVAALQRVVLPSDEEFDDFDFYGKAQALILCPTRELALQVSREIEMAGKGRKARVLTIYGGVSYDDQLQSLTDGIDIVVGTPGRLLDLHNRGSLDLSHISVMVIDEADEMLDLGFLSDVESLLNATPKDRQTMLFSATMPAAIMSLARTYMTQAVNIRAEGRDAQATVPDTTQFIYQSHDLDKPEIVARIIQARDLQKMMVFCKTKRSAQKLADELKDRGFKAASIHGDLNQAARERALRRFRSGQITVLVCTDVAARGIDVSGVTHVVNMECPDDAKTYVHRIGRTGRAGAKGVAVTLVDWQDVVRWKVINKTLNLSFDDPVETYSTSKHLFSDLNIPEDALPRLQSASSARSAKSNARSNRARNRSRARNSGRESSVDTEAKAAPRPKKTRVRRRTRNGKPVQRIPKQDSTTDSDH